MNAFYKETEGIYRLRIPFDTVYTSVFLIHGEKTVLVDCATTDSDVDTVILPALSCLGLSPSDIDILVLSHMHGDHAGGLSRILSHAPHIEVVKEVRQLADGLFTYPLPGHTLDSIGVLDVSAGTLISGDGLQGAGVDKYRRSIACEDAYTETIERIRRDARIGRILFSHAYEPWFSDRADGREAVEKCLSDCLA